MPSRPTSPCRLCGRARPLERGLCLRCRPLQAVAPSDPTRDAYEAQPERAEDRRFYASTRWRNFRQAFLCQHPLCVRCQFSPATEVDHVIPRKHRPDLSYDAQNCQALCKPCHSRKTSRDNRLRGPRPPRGGGV